MRNKPIRHKSVSYAKWGYFFIAPFFIVFVLCQLVPLFNTFYNSLFEYFTDGLTQIGPKYIGLDNYKTIFTPANGEIRILTYTKNTMVMWLLGAIPQLLFALLLALIFTATRIKVRGQTFFKTVIYMPNLIMASAFSMLFFTLFSNVGPVNQIITELGGQVFDFFHNPWSERGIVAFINFLMWFGNTTILLMAGIMGIDASLFEAAAIDGANSNQVFFRVTLPLLSPILVYVIITSLIGGLQMYDVPQILSAGKGGTDGCTMTLMMYLNRLISTSKNYGLGGAVSAIIFVITGILSVIVFFVTANPGKKGGK